MQWANDLVGKVATGVVFLAVLAGGITWWQMEPETRQHVFAMTGRLVGWGAIVLALPWLTFFLIRKVASFDSNLAGGVLVAGYTLVEAAWLLWLVGHKDHGAGGWTFIVAATLIAGVYNVFASDWIAEKFA